jgi:hypothetical protein
MKGVKQGGQLRRGGRPCCLEEKRAETIGPGTSVVVHVLVCPVDFITVERSSKVVKRQGALWVEIMELKIPACCTRTP